MGSNFNHFKPNGSSHFYQLDMSISNFRVSCSKQTVQILIRCRMLKHLIWICTVCLCATKWTIDCYYINITFPARVIVENIIPRNVIINRGAAEVDNHISRDVIFDYHQSRKCNIYFIIPNRTLDPLFSEELLLLNIPIMVRGDPKGK